MIVVKLLISLVIWSCHVHVTRSQFHFESTLRGMMSGECSLLAFDIPANTIQNIVDIKNVKRDIDLTIFVTDTIKFHMEPIRKEAQCLYAISAKNKSKELQQIMLPTYSRQLILIKDEVTAAEHGETVPKVLQHHHPIITLELRQTKIVQSVVCRFPSKRIVINVFSLDTTSWLNPLLKNPLDTEKMCNNNKHPLEGKHLTGSVFAITPFLVLNLETNMIEGGAAMDIIDTIAQYYKFTYNVSFSENVFIFHQNGSIGGSLGEVVNNEVDFSLEQAFIVGGMFGRLTSLTYHLFFAYIELKPKQLPLYLNIMYPFDNFTWFMYWMFLLFVWLTMSTLFIYQKDGAKFKGTTLLVVFEMMYGIMFQEYHRGRKADRRKMTTKFRFMWVAITTFLAMAFSGNLKSSLVRRNYEKRTMTLDEMIDKDMTVHMSNTFEDFLDSSTTKSRFNTRLLCQVRKKNSIFPIKSNFFDQMYQPVLREGGASNMYEQSVQVLRNWYLKSGKDFPIIIIPEWYLMMAHGIFFQQYDPRVDYFNPVIDALRDTGLIDFFFRKLMPPRNMKDPTVEVKEESLVIDYFYVPLIFWISGLAIGIIFIFGEVCIRTKLKRRSRTTRSTHTETDKFAGSPYKLKYYVSSKSKFVEITT